MNEIAHKLENLFLPKSIAVIGATNNHHKNAGRVIINLQKSRFSGELYAVNPKYQMVSGVECFSSLLEIPNEIDMVCIIIPAMDIPNTLRECIKKKVKIAIIFSSGFSESGEIGEQLQSELSTIIEGTDLRVYGPNVPGMFDFQKKWGVSFSPQFEPHDFLEGSIGLITQGGSLGRAILDSNQKGIGFRYWFSPGTEIDLNTMEFLEWFVFNKEIEIIVMVLENALPDKEFIELANEALLKQKPIIFIKLGQYPISINAINYHIGTTKSYVPRTLMRHSGVISVNDLDELVGVAWLFQKFKGQYRNRALIYSWAGGSAILVTDMCEKYGVCLATLSDELRLSIQNRLMINERLMNPLDITTLIYENPSLFSEILDEIIKSEEFDIILVPIPFKIEQQTEEMAQDLIRLSAKYNIPIIPIFFSTGEISGTTYEVISDSGLPYFTKVETAIKSLGLFLQYKSFTA